MFNDTLKASLQKLGSEANIFTQVIEDFAEKYRFLVEERSGVSGCDLEDISVDGSLIVDVLDEVVEEYKQSILEE